jgi:hypothetical protein
MESGGYASELTRLDGPGLIDWLEEELGPEWRHEAIVAHPNIERRIYDWKRGNSIPTMDCVDLLLTRLGLTLALLPERLWIERPQNKPAKRNSTPEEIALAVERVKNGESREAIAPEFGVTARTISNWCFKAGVEPIKRGTHHRPCKKAGCHKPIEARGFCKTHYMADYRKGHRQGSRKPIIKARPIAGLRSRQVASRGRPRGELVA